MAALPHAAALRLQVEDSLAARVPNALSPAFRRETERNTCGVEALDKALQGGIPVGAITELVGAECSGRTTMALAYVAAKIQSGSVTAWVDVEDRLDPVSAALSGVDWNRLLWVRCHAEKASLVTPLPVDTNTTTPATQISGSTQARAISAAPSPTPRNGGSPHPRAEGRGMDRAIEDLLSTQPRSAATPRTRRPQKGTVKSGTPSAPNQFFPSRSLDREEQVPTDRRPSPRTLQRMPQPAGAPEAPQTSPRSEARPLQFIAPQSSTARSRVQHSWPSLEQALKATDLILQSGGFGLVVLDLGSVPPEMSWRIPLASWFRYRAACQRTRASLVLLTQHACARSSAELTVRLQPGSLQAQNDVLTALNFRAEVERARFQHAETNVIPLRKPPLSIRPGAWKGQAAWAL